jgi:nitroreductase
MDFWETVAARHSVRRFTAEPVTDEQVQRLLETAVLAPSAGNRQPWHFVVVRDKTTREALAAAAYGQGFVAQAPVVIAVCAEPEQSAARYGDRGTHLYCLQDTAAAATYILLGAAALGLGTCWVGAFDEEYAAEVLNLPARLRPVALIPVGHPVKQPRRPARRPLAEVVTRIG